MTRHTLSAPLVGVVVLTAFLGESFAIAQDAPAALGIRAGNVEFHPGVFLESAYDSNLLFDDPSELGSRDPVSVFVLRPGLSLRALTPAPTTADWTASARLWWEQYLSSLESVGERSGLESSIDTGVILWPKGTVSARPQFRYMRTNGPADEYQQRSYNQHMLEPGFELRVAPYGGVVFSSGIAYDLRARLFDELSDLNALTHRFTSNTRWNFLPQTALSLLLEQRLVTYMQEVREARSGDAPFELTNVNSTPFRGMLGISGLLFDRVNVSAFAGYGYTFYEAGDNEHMFIGQAELGYQWTEGTKLSFGYTRNFEDSSIGNYYTFDRLMGRFQTVIAQRIEASLTGRVGFLDFSALPAEVGPRDDTVFDVDTSVGYRFVPGLTARLSYVLRGNATDFATVSNGQRAVASYIKHQVLLNIAYEY